MRSASWIARYEGSCERCGMPIKVGDDIRYHNDFSCAVHDGCRAPSVTTRTDTVADSRPVRAIRAAAVREPELCPECQLAHAGACW